MSIWQTRRVLVPLVAVALLAACAPDATRERLRARARAEYDASGVLQLITYDANDDGVVDMWRHMNGRRTLRTETDTNHDGVVDRWEHYNTEGEVMTVGLSLGADGVEDAWAYGGPDGGIQRIEISSGRDGRVDVWEIYDGGELVRREYDTNRSGLPDKRDTFAGGRLVQSAFDEDHDGQHDRRLTYDEDGTLVLIESAPDADGRFTERKRLN